MKKPIPNLVVAARVLNKMRSAAESHIEDETGEAMIGLIVPGSLSNGIPTIYILDTISPDDSAVRQYHTFQQGDERQDELIWWLQENWQAGREKRGFWSVALGTLGAANRSRWDVPLRYLGDWHKQPGYMIQPSVGDLRTALGWLDDEENGMEFLLAPIVTLGHEPTIAPGVSGAAGVNYLLVPQSVDEGIRVDFWYIDRDARMFAPIAPTIYPDDQLPALAPYPWHLLQTQRIADELRLMEADGLFTSVTLWDTDNHPPLDVCFLTARVGGEKLLIVVTPHDYPQRPPRAYTAPFVQMRPDDDMYTVFQTAWKASTPLAVHFAWEPAHMLIEFIHAAETAAGIRAPAVSSVAAPVTTIHETVVEKPETPDLTETTSTAAIPETVSTVAAVPDADEEGKPHE